MAAAVALTPRAHNGTPLPSDHILRQLLGESTNAAARVILGCGYDTVPALRNRLDAPAPWSGKSNSFATAAGVVARRRWGDYPELIPEPIERVALMELIEVELAKRVEEAPRKPAAPTMTPGECILHIKRFKAEQHRWPTIAELAAFTDRLEPQITDKVARLMRDGTAEWDGKAIRLAGQVAAINPVEDQKWSREELEAHLRMLGVDPTPRPRAQSQRIQAHFISLAERGESTVMNNPASVVREAERAANNESIRVLGVAEPVTDPDPEPSSPPDTQPVPESIPEPLHEQTLTEGADMARPYSRNDNVQWPEDAVFIHLVEAEYAATTRGAAERLAERFECSTYTIQNHINLVFPRMNRQRPKQEAGREHVHNWGTDAEFVAVVERVYQESPWNPCDALAVIYSAPSKQVSSHVSRVYKRLGRPRPQAVAGRKSKAEVAMAMNEPVPAAPAESSTPEPKLEVAPMAGGPCGPGDVHPPDEFAERARPGLTLRRVLAALANVDMSEESLRSVVRELVA